MWNRHGVRNEAVIRTERDELRAMVRAFRQRTIEIRRIDAQAHGIDPRLAVNEELQWQNRNIPGAIDVPPVKDKWDGIDWEYWPAQG